MTEFLCGVDIGGTFTDCVLIAGSGEIHVGKSATTPHAFEEGVANAIADAALAVGDDGAAGSVQSRITRLVHGTTIGTNAVVERRGAKVGLLTTKGHADTIHFMRANGSVVGLGPEDLLWISRALKPSPLVPKSLIAEATERIDRHGDVVVELDDDSVDAALDSLVEQDIDALAICLLWSFRNGAHEDRIRARVAERFPGLFVTASADLLPRWGEYERTVGTVVNCYIGPVMRGYLERLSARLSADGLPTEPRIYQSAGGAMGLGSAMESPLFTLGSGPAAGIEACSHLARHLGLEDVVATDMGGTTFDVGLVVGGQPVINETGEISQYEYKSPHIETRSIGAGGGSLIWFDERSGSLKVGPASTGADPGPACYDRGGERPAITDANLVLGRLNPDYFLGGKRRLSVERATAALERVGAELGWDVVRTASAALEIAEFQMAELIRRMTVQNGNDPRELAVFAYGGAGPLHAAVLARELGSRDVVIPLGDLGSVWSAFGAAIAGPAASAYADEIHKIPADPALLRTRLEELSAQAHDRLSADGVSAEGRTTSWSVSMKYAFQVHEISVPVDDALFAGDFNADVMERLEREYERVFGPGTSYAEAGAEIVSFQARVRQPSPHRFPATDAAARTRMQPDDSRLVYWRGERAFVDTPIFRDKRVVPGAALEGPGLIELTHTSIAIEPGAAAHVDAMGNVHIQVQPIAGGEEKR